MMQAACVMALVVLSAGADGASTPAPSKAPVADVAAATKGTSFLDEPSQVQTARPRSVAQAVGMALVVGMMAVGGCVAYGWAHARRGPKVAGDKINLLAYKALGGRQRLALVEVCGERLLLSANEREVTLLSHLPGAPEAEDMKEAPASVVAEATQSVAAAPTTPGLTAPDRAESEGQTVAALEQALAEREATPAHGPETSPLGYSADLAGLHRWQAHAQAERRA